VPTYGTSPDNKKSLILLPTGWEKGSKGSRIQGFRDSSVCFPGI
jgi:hypothetical protein